MAVFLIYAVSCISQGTLPNIDVELAKQYGWSVQEVALPSTLLYFAIAFMAFGIGSMVDKFSPRFVLALGGLSSLLCLFAYYFVSELWQLYLIYVVYAFSIAATGVLVGMVLISRWFNQYRGLAVGIFTTGSSVGNIFFQYLVASAKSEYGLQTAILVMAGVATVLVLGSLLVMRNRPQDMGLQALGKAKETSAKPFANGPSLRQALRQVDFYVLLFVTAAMWFCISSVMARHLPIFLNDLSLEFEERAKVSILFAVFGIVGKLLFGFMSDVWGKLNIMLFASVCMVAGCLLLRLTLQAPDTYLLLTAVVYGIGYSGTFTMTQLVVAEYYHGKHYGKILGVVTTADTLAGAAGIYVLGWVRTQYQSYAPAFNLLVVLCVLSLGCVAYLRMKQAKPKPVANA